MAAVAITPMAHTSDDLRAEAARGHFVHGKPGLRTGEYLEPLGISWSTKDG
jgi:hypothetical protein